VFSESYLNVYKTSLYLSIYIFWTACWGSSSCG